MVLQSIRDRLTGIIAVFIFAILIIAVFQVRTRSECSKQVTGFKTIAATDINDCDLQLGDTEVCQLHIPGAGN